MLSPQAQEVIDYLREHLTVSVETEEFCRKVTVTVAISIGDEVITTEKDYFTIPDPNNNEYY